MAKTSVELNRDKIELAQKLGPKLTLKDLIDKALDAYIAEARRHSMLKLLGSHFFEGDLKGMRKNRGPAR